MATRRYTNEELRHLRSSPLVKKPDRLPPIEQWIDESQQTSAQTDKTARTPAARLPRSTVGGDKSPMGNFSTGQRPTLLHTRTTGSRSGDDFTSSLPKAAFSSTRSITRLTAFSSQSATDAPEEEEKAGERHHVRKNTSTFDRENWSRRPAPEGDHARTDSNGDRLARQGRDAEKDGRWATRDDRRQNGQPGGWRDRESNRRDRPWDRNDHSERDPEWFDEPATAKGDNDFSSMSQPRTQEDFQRWKDTMKTNKQQPDVESEPAPVQEPPRKVLETLKIEGLSDRPFGSMHAVKSPDSANQSSKAAKSSRFASMFKKEDSPQLPQLEQQPPISVPSPAQESRDDREGFQRILQMLGGTNINTAPASAPAEPRSPPKSASGARQRSRFFDSAKSPESTSAVPLPEHFQAQVPTSAVPYNGQKPGDQRPQHDRSRSSYQGGASTPDVNLQNLLAGQRPQRSAASNKDSEFLLGLLQGAGARPSSQVSHAEPSAWRPPPEPQPRAPGFDEHSLHDIHRQQPDPKSQQMPRAPPGFDDQARLLHNMQPRNGPEAQGFPPQHFDPNQPRWPPGLPPGIPPGMTLPPHAMPPQQGPAPHDMPFMPTLPPGLPPHIRHPQGFPSNPNIFQTPQQQMSPQHFGNGGAMNGVPLQQAGPPPGLGRGMPPSNVGQLPPDLASMKAASAAAHAMNGYGRGQHSEPFQQRR